MAVYGYIRVSHTDSAESGLSPEAQRMTIMARVEYEIRKGNPLVWGKTGAECTTKQTIVTDDGMYIDLAVSAFKKSVLIRGAGKLLDQVLDRGDTLVVARLDRAFRSARDFHLVTDTWQRRGVRIIFCSPDVDLSTAEGKMFAGMVALWSQFESEMKSLRNREISAYLKKSGRRHCRFIAYGFKQDPKNPKMLIPDNDARRTYQRIAKLRRRGVRAWKIADKLEREVAASENRPPLPRAHGKRYWTADRIDKIYRAFRLGKIDPPTDEPLPQEYAQMALARHQANKPVYDDE